jgi:hypothetical protein
MSRSASWVLTSAALACAIGSAAAQPAAQAAAQAAAQTATQAAAELELPSCVEGSPPMRVLAGAERAALDAADIQRFHDAARARHALYQHGALVPTQVLLLRRSGSTSWQYVTLMRGGRAGLCFTAVFSAERFEFTREWIAKYQPRPAEAVD